VTNSIYGYYIVQATSGVLMWSERDVSAPFTVAVVGDAIKITPQIGAN
jgi:uncharacterized protein YlxW (UPF0749 family)